MFVLTFRTLVGQLAISLIMQDCLAGGLEQSADLAGSIRQWPLSIKICQ